jgi:hypothetical protein
MTQLDEFRKMKDEFFKQQPDSPLTLKQREAFTSLEYFPENPALRLDLSIEEYPVKDVIEMQTSTGDLQKHTRYGRIRFLVEGQEVSLTIYKDPHGYFLPFADSLAGTETYGAGRYLEPEPRGKNRVLVDFNLAYNPYCAYNDQYSCPLTPFENRLKVPIRAGEKLPSGNWVSHPEV